MKLNHEMCNEFFSHLPIKTKRYIILMTGELESAKKKHPKWPKDIIHKAAIVVEESGELIRSAIQYVFEKGRFYDMHHEAIQTGAMCLRFLNELPIKTLPDETEDNVPEYQN